MDIYNPFYIYIRCLYCRGIVSGYDDGTFRPYANITRGQVAKIVANAAGSHDVIPSTTQTFTDVPLRPARSGSTSSALALQGYISGYTDTGSRPCTEPAASPCFLPYNYVTRGQLAKIDANAAGYNDTPSPAQSFADVPPSDPFYVYIERLARRGIVNGYDCGAERHQLLRPGCRRRAGRATCPTTAPATTSPAGRPRRSCRIPSSRSTARRAARPSSANPPRGAAGIPPTCADKPNWAKSLGISPNLGVYFMR